MASDHQVDLFLTSIIDAPVKDQRDLMEFPHFALAKQARYEPMIYENPKRGIRVEVRAGHKGIATIWDKDVMIYCASLINEQIERGQTPTATIQFHAYDFLRLAGRGTGKRSYQLLQEALDRLQSTSVRTTIKAGDKEEKRFFSWIESARIIERKNAAGNERMAAIEVTLNQWIFRALTQDRSVLTIDSRYFSLKGGLERRLYELARKHCGRQKRWDISLENLWEKCGSQTELRFFKRDLLKIIDADTLPSYSIAASFDPKKKPVAPMDSPSVRRRYAKNANMIISFFLREAGASLI
ncbi:replication initiator protein A [Nisaea sediminum]|uniref:replication initiator protein A n=2 Tax=Pseudomonadota TaxID=1224 RepID=UPI0018661087|nr:replication initiator protein A [Nisaea sediminum]